MSVSINGNSNIPQPQTLREEYIQIQSENTAIAGGLQRNRIGQKKQATMTYEMISSSDYQTLLSAFTTGSGVGYNNNLSNKPGGIFTFSGLPYFNEYDYVKGGSLYTGLQVRIREQ